MVVQGFNDGSALAPLRRHGIQHMPAQKVAGDPDHQAEQERDAPTPGLERCIRHRRPKPAPTADPSRMPPVAPHAASAPIRPRRPSGACSTRNTIELVYSPPTE